MGKIQISRGMLTVGQVYDGGININFLKYAIIFESAKNKYHSLFESNVAVVAARRAAKANTKYQLIH